MWKVKITDEAAKIFESKELTNDDRQVIQDWAKTVRDYGPEKLRERPDKWADHPLAGTWDGHRSSRFSYKGRIIYKIENKVVTVTVARITPEHDYRKEKGL